MYPFKNVEFFFQYHTHTTSGRVSREYSVTASILENVLHKLYSNFWRKICTRSHFPIFTGMVVAY